MRIEGLSCLSCGLSPRVRGNHRGGDREGQFPGSIPACAGEPVISSLRLTPNRVYPRVCGGTVGQYPVIHPHGGLSPRVRGNLRATEWRKLCRGSIPACAGEPTNARGHTQKVAVYPRVCGGTVWLTAATLATLGLSPRVRGNQGHHQHHAPELRSIPACAGEPNPCRQSLQPDRVYPRVCGGTTMGASCSRRPPGLSPRVRGNLDAGLGVVGVPGSIPACAGEPGRFSEEDIMPEVYPRVCGGTAAAVARMLRRQGLSPRVRGNRVLVWVVADAVRSIPACAGEPRPEVGNQYPGEVYPRVCGGTVIDANRFSRQARGLSPRVRGNLRG